MAARHGTNSTKSVAADEEEPSNSSASDDDDDDDGDDDIACRSSTSAIILFSLGRFIPTTTKYFVSVSLSVIVGSMDIPLRRSLSIKSRLVKAVAFGEVLGPRPWFVFFSLAPLCEHHNRTDN